VDCYNLTSIGIGAFENCANLKNVALYEGVDSIGENAFKGCDCTIYCMFDEQPETWNTNWNPDGCEVVWLGGAVKTWNISKTAEDDVIAKLYSNIHHQNKWSLFISGKGKMKDYSRYEMPWYFDTSNIASVAILDGVTNIGQYAFYKCTSLTNTVIPDSVTSIGEWAFASCSRLTSINIPEVVTNVGYGAFCDCSNLTSITIPNGVTSIGS
jgi:hypothetical protein